MQWRTYGGRYIQIKSMRKVSQLLLPSRVRTYHLMLPHWHRWNRCDSDSGDIRSRYFHVRHFAY